MSTPQPGRGAQDAWARGLGYRSEKTACIRRIIGWPCIRKTALGRSEEVMCPCEKRHDTINRLFDHSRAWRLPDGGLIVTGEPYDLDPGDPEIARFGEVIRHYGLQVHATEESPYYPGRTTLVTVSARLPLITPIDGDGRPLLAGYLKPMPRGVTLLKVWCRWCCDWHTHGAADRGPGETTMRAPHCYAPDGYQVTYTIRISDVPFLAVSHIPAVATAAQARAIRHGERTDSVKRLRLQPEPVVGGPIATYGGIVRQRKRDLSAHLAATIAGRSDTVAYPRTGEWPHGEFGKAHW